MLWEPSAPRVRVIMAVCGPFGRGALTPRPGRRRLRSANHDSMAVKSGVKCPGQRPFRLARCARRDRITRQAGLGWGRLSLRDFWQSQKWRTCGSGQSPVRVRTHPPPMRWWRGGVHIMILLHARSVWFLHTSLAGARVPTNAYAQAPFRSRHSYPGRRAPGPRVPPRWPWCSPPLARTGRPNQGAPCGRSFTSPSL